jgi:iron complex outermembrane receptor protein
LKLKLETNQKLTKQNQNQMFKRLFLIMPLLFLSIWVLSQSKVITGHVTSEDDDGGLPGVTIKIKGTTTGTITDIDGYYSMENVGNSDTLVFSYIGFQDQIIPVDNRNNISVIMVAASEMLEEVVITALGIKRQKRQIGYSTDKVENEVLTNSNTDNVLNAVIGRSTGVMVSQSNGIEGGSTRITIRGNNNLLGNNQPLIVVDNIPLENQPGLTDIGRGVDWGNAISDINPNDIEDFQILKGGPASAHYGSKGANGVILITTKRGKKQKGIGVNYSFRYKISQPFRYREVQNKYGHGGPISLTPASFPMSGDTLLYPGIYGNDNLILDQEGNTSTTSEQFGYYGSAVSWGPEMEGQMVKWWDGEMRSYSPQPDNYKDLFSNGVTQTHHLSASGGNEKGSLRLSITREDNTPIIENSNYDRTNISFGSSIHLSNKITADVAMTYVKFNRLNSPLLGEDENSFSKGFLYSYPRSYQGIDRENYMLADGTLNPQQGFPFLYVSDKLWWNYYQNNTNLERDKYLASVSLTYDITSWLFFTARLGRDFNLEHFDTRNNPYYLDGLSGGYYASSLKREYTDNIDLLLQANKNIGDDFSINFTLGANRYDYEIYGIGGNSGTWYYPYWYSFSNLTETSFNEDGTINVAGDNPSDLAAEEFIRRKRNNSVFSFMDMSYKNYLFLELTARNDWSSTLPPGSNSYFYPSASLSFIPTDAFSFFENTSWMNFMKIRAGISQTATDTDPYQRYFFYQTGLFGGQQTSALPTTIPPYQLKPQRVNSFETGLNVAFLDSRIDLDFTYYYFYSFDQILPGLPLPTSSGATGITTNEGVVTNQGIEIQLKTVPIHTQNFTFKSDFQFSRNSNKINSLGGDAEMMLLAEIWGLNGPSMALREGDQYGTIYGYDYVYHENGQPILNDEGTHYQITDTRVPIGNSTPKFLAGWTNVFHYKGFTLTTLIDAKVGGDIYAGSYVIGLQSGQSPETLIERDGGGLPYTDPDGNTSNIGVILPGVYEDGTPNDKVVHYYYKYLPNAGGWGHFLSTPGVLENTWVKMREITLSYDIPVNLLRKTKIFQSLSLSVTGRDLFYIYTTLPDQINPEGIMGSGDAQGFEWASLPSVRSFTFGISAKF